MHRGTAALVTTRRQTPRQRQAGVRVGGLSTEEIRQRYDAVRNFLYHNLLMLKNGELASFDDLYARFLNSTISEINDYIQRLDVWEKRVAELQGLPPGYTDNQPGVHISPETAESVFGVGMALGAVGVIGFGLLAAGLKKRRAA